MPHGAKPLTARDYETLNELCPSFSDEAPAWGTPLDWGGSNGSHHSATFMKLAGRGLVDFRQRGAGDEGINKPPSRRNARGSKVYRITPAGVEATWAWRVAQGSPRRTRAEYDAWWAEQEKERKARKAVRKDLQENA